MKESTVRSKYLYVLQEPFSLDIPYTDRQRVVIATDEQVAAERQSRGLLAAQSQRPSLPKERERKPLNGGVSESTGDESRATVAARQLQRGLRGLQGAGMGLKRGLDDRARSTVRRHLGILMIGRAEAGVLRFDLGHPLTNVLYVGHPARPDLYFPAAQFHRRVFEHKFAEAVRLLTSLGASRIALRQEQGQARESEKAREAQFSVPLGFTRVHHESLGSARTRNEWSSSSAVFDAEFPGSREPFVPDDLCWYPDEQTWQMIAHTRIAGGAEKTSLEVRYLTDYGIDMHVVRTARTCGVKIGGKFHEHHDTIWRLDAEFPSLAN
jgi:hypothetical protein